MNNTAEQIASQFIRAKDMVARRRLETLRNVLGHRVEWSDCIRHAENDRNDCKYHESKPGCLISRPCCGPWNGMSRHGCRLRAWCRSLGSRIGYSKSTSM